MVAFSSFSFAVAVEVGGRCCLDRGVVGWTLKRPATITQSGILQLSTGVDMGYAPEARRRQVRCGRLAYKVNGKLSAAIHPA